MSDFRTHKELLATDDTYRAARGLGPVAATIALHAVDPTRREPTATPARSDAMRAARGGATDAEALMATAPASGTSSGIDPTLGEYLDACKAQRGELARLDKELGVEIDRAEAELVDQYVNAGKDTEQFGDRIGTLRPTIWARKVDETVTGEQVAAALVADGLGHLVTPESYNSQRLSAFLRDLEEEKKPIPPHLATVIEATERYAVGFTTRRETRARRRIRGTPSSVLDGVVDTSRVGASGD